ncbi:MAG TPA: phospholipase D-like domain-containing protein [Mucilaginibacter sp.]|jgi:phosphatidylserine/phosphatidylglycerophosphate/cardiolipin synthase-like enzyme
MTAIKKAKAYSNGEVGYISWQLDSMIHGCLGFEITRIYPDDTASNTVLPAWVPFKGQSNPDWIPQDTSVWPIQKLNWRDLTLVKKRDSFAVHAQGVKVQYAIRPLIAFKDGFEEVKTMLKPNYTGTPLKLAYADEGKKTNIIIIGTQYGNVRTTFTNGIISTQWLTRALNKLGKKPKDILQTEIKKQGGAIRTYLTGQVLNTLKMLLEQAKQTDGATLKMAIYELSDNELITAIIAVKEKVEIILSNTSKDSDGNWDVENAGPRQQLKTAGIKVHDRYFNNDHIGHNKFVIYLENGTPKSVMMGSTNWTPTGLCAQSNNASIIVSDEVAKLYDGYWKALKTDTALFTTPNPVSAKSSNVQGSVFRARNIKPNRVITLNDKSKTEITVWFSPNTIRTTVDKTQVPPDLSYVYSLMRKAEKAIFFAVFLPGRSNDLSGSVMTNIITEAINIGQNDNSMMVYGAISDPTAMPNYVNPPKKSKDTDDDDNPPAPKVETPTTYDKNNVHIVRAFNLRTDDIIGSFEAELYSAGHAIIHDKVMVIDPFSDNATAVCGSHNFGFKASYGNDENLVIIRNNPALVQAFAIHILDIYEHYRFRAVQKELHDEHKPEFDGFLSVSDGWLEKAMETTGKGDLADYICS